MQEFMTEKLVCLDRLDNDFKIAHIVQKQIAKDLDEQKKEFETTFRDIRHSVTKLSGRVAAFEALEDTIK